MISPKTNLMMMMEKHELSLTHEFLKGKFMNLSDATLNPSHCTHLKHYTAYLMDTLSDCIRRAHKSHGTFRWVWQHFAGHLNRASGHLSNLFNFWSALSFWWFDHGLKGRKKKEKMRKFIFVERVACSGARKQHNKNRDSFMQKCSPPGAKLTNTPHQEKSI